MSDSQTSAVESRVLVLAPTGADGELSRAILTEAGFDCRVCADLPALCRELTAGGGSALLTDEALAAGDPQFLASTLQYQPAWSDMPILFLTGKGADSAAALWAMEMLGNVTILERPVRVVTLVSALRTALRARRRQYELRDRLQAQALLAAVVESSEDAIVSKTLDGVITSWNTGAQRLFGYAPAEAIGQHITLIIPPDRLHEEEMIIARLRRGESIEHYETIRRTKTGRLVDISVTISPVRDSGGRVVGASKVARDITGQKQSQERMRQSEERFRFLAETLPSVVWTAAPDGTITYVNQRWLDYCGMTAEQSAMNWPDLIVHPDDRDRCVAHWTKALREGTPYSIEVRNRRHDGVYRWFMTRAVPFRDAGGEIISWFGVTTDIQDQMEMQEQLKLADRRKDEFLATLAHELRNPLSPIYNGLKLLPKIRDNPAEFDETRRMMETQLKHMVHLLDDLLDISRIGRNKIQLRKEPIELAWVVNDAVEATRPLIEERNHQLAVNIPAEPVHLEADSVRLTQVLSNLLNNAAKYTPPGGRIWLTAEVTGQESGVRNQESGSGGSGAHGSERHTANPLTPVVVIRVRDNGMGMSDELLPRVFDLFEQGETHLANASGGLGIGLALVKSLVEMHGGRVDAHSEGLDKGSEFVVRLPVIAGSEVGRPDEPQAEPGAAPPRRILVVDDNRASADSMANLLRTFGHQVCVAYDAPEALTAAATFNPDVGLLDVGLPGMDGHELARTLRDRANGQRLTLIAMTGWGREEDRKRSLAAGFDAHLVKPIKMSAVCDLLAAEAAGR